MPTGPDPKIDLEALKGLSLDELESALASAADLRRANRMDFFKPYPTQRAFIAMGKTKPERLMMAGNQIAGKSETGAYELAAHLTGLYPPDWDGKRYSGPNNWWAAGVSTTVVRDIQQAKLCGEPGVEDAMGTGYIPKHCFAGKPTLARGAVANAYDTVSVYHHNTDGIRDGVSTLQFKSYEQGRAKFQGKTLTGGIWWDEEPPEDIYNEGKARCAVTDGMQLVTFTPLEGMSTVVLHFLESEEDSIGVLQVRAADCPHVTPEKIAELKRTYPEHEWEARINGEPFMGSGRIFRTPENLIKFPADALIPPHWALIWGIDFGISHPFAAVLGAWDRDLDIIYLVATYRAADALPLVHSEAIRRICAEAPVSWPQDGARREAGTGENLAKVYKALDLKMLPSHAHFAEGGYSTEAAILEMQQRFAAGKLKVREDLADFFDEYRAYHRSAKKTVTTEAGMIVKLRDDLISAAMKIIMDKRHARLAAFGWTPRPTRRPGDRPTRRPDSNPWTGRPVNPALDTRYPAGDHPERYRPSFNQRYS